LVALLLFSLFPLFIQTVTSLPAIDTLIRGLGLTYCYIDPTDSSNSTKLAKTDALLRSLNKDVEIIGKPISDGGFVSWRITSKHDNLQSALSALEVVSHVEKEKLQERHLSSKTNSHAPWPGPLSLLFSGRKTKAISVILAIQIEEMFQGKLMALFYY
jgi:hypothetical protein